MRVVVDTNVLVSGLLTPFGASSEVARLIVSESLVVCYDARILAEYREVLLRPRFRFNPDRVADLIDYIRYSGLPVSAPSLAEPLPDPDDRPFLEVALAAGAVIISGNAAHFPREARRGVEFFSPGDFLEYYRRGRAR